MRRSFSSILLSVSEYMLVLALCLVVVVVDDDDDEDGCR